MTVRNEVAVGHSESLRKRQPITEILDAIDVDSVLERRVAEHIAAARLARELGARPGVAETKVLSKEAVEETSREPRYYWTDSGIRADRGEGFREEMLTVTLDTGTTLRVWLPEARYRSPEDQPSLELMLDFRFHIEDAFRQDFDVLAVCEAPLTGQWRFAFLPFSNVPVPPKPALFDPAGLRDWTREFPGS